MTQLACSSCGRGVAAIAPLVQLTASERLCPRCGAPLRDERRASERRSYIRRQAERALATRRERRHADRRTAQRRAAADPFRYNPLVDGRIRWQTVQRVYGEDR
jgi:predicted RNA-binding Zn-ribbon protein involved in translation (DUF1610 family)